MFELKKDEEITRLVNITKSNSGISGPELACAHIELGRYMAKAFKFLDPSETAIVAVLRGGIFFAEGIYFELGCRFSLYDPKNEVYVRPGTRNVILVDSVINTGKTLDPLITENTYLACCVINEGAVSKYQDILYTVRVSENFFIGDNVHKQIGKVGPDTTMRLFNEL